MFVLNNKKKQNKQRPLLTAYFQFQDKKKDFVEDRTYILICIVRTISRKSGNIRTAFYSSKHV